MKRTITFLAVFIGALMLFLTDVNADIFTHTDKDGVVHFTNLRPQGKNRRKYKVYLKNPPMRKARPGVVPIGAKDRNPGRYSRFDEFIKEASQTHSVPEPFIRAVIRVESDYDPRVVSWAGARGLMQLMPATGKRMGVVDPFNPRQNIMGGTRYLRHLANLFGGNMVLTIAGYHAGEGAVRKYGGVPPYTSTHGYIKRVLKFYNHYKTKQAN